MASSPEGGPARVVAGAAAALGLSRAQRRRGRRDREWLLFTDADCEPPADLLDRLWDPEPAPDCGVVAGEARGDASQTALLARWARSRRGAIASHHRELGPRPAGTTANLLVRRAAFEAVGGFCEVRSDADTELCWRLAERAQAPRAPARAPSSPTATRSASATLSARPPATAPAGAGCAARSATQVPGMPLARPLGRAVAGTLAWTLALRFERAAFKLVDGLAAAAGWWGYAFGDNRPALAA